jgi:hypothetical protein
MWSKKRPAERSAAPLATLEVRDDLTLPLLTEIRDLLKEQCEFNAWLKAKLLAANTLGH